MYVCWAQPYIRSYIGFRVGVQVGVAGAIEHALACVNRCHYWGPTYVCWVHPYIMSYIGFRVAQPYLGCATIFRLRNHIWGPTLDLEWPKWRNSLCPVSGVQCLVSDVTIEVLHWIQGGATIFRLGYHMRSHIGFRVGQVAQPYIMWSGATIASRPNHIVRSATYKVPNRIRPYIGFIVEQPYVRWCNHS